MFGKDGLLSGAKRFEFRAEQQRIGKRCRRSPDRKTSSGSGSRNWSRQILAYLVPAVLCALKEKRKAIILPPINSFWVTRR
jgi:hypothetical protein